MDQRASVCPPENSSEASLPAYQMETSMDFGHLEQGAAASQSRLGIPTFEEASFLEVAGSFGHDFPEMLPIKLEPQQSLGDMQQGSDVLEHNNQRDTSVSQGQGCLETLMCPASIDKLLGEVVNDVPFPELDLSGTWDMGMQLQPHFFMPQIDEMPPIPDIMPGVDLPADTTLLPLRDVSIAEMPPNVTVTLKARRTKQHASLGHLTKVMRPMNGLDRPPLHASAAGGSREASEPGPAPGPRMHAGARLQRHASDVAAAGPPAQPPPRRQRSAPLRDRPPSQPQDRFLQEQPRPGPHVRLHAAANRPAEATPALAAAAPALKRTRRSEDAPGGRPAAEEEEPEPPQRKLRRRGDIPERLAAILENERSPSSQDSGERGDRSGSHEGSPSAVTGCKLSKAACRAQGALHQLTEEEVMEVEAKLSPDATEEERTAAYKRARNRSAARKTRKRKVETVQELQEHMQTLGQQNRGLISQLNNLLNQVEVSSRENATLKGLLRYLQLQPDAIRRTPSLANLEALKNDMTSSQRDSGAAAAPNQAPGPRERAGDRGQGPPPTKSSLGAAGRSKSGKLSDRQVQEMAMAASEGI